MTEEYFNPRAYVRHDQAVISRYTGGAISIHVPT